MMASELFWGLAPKAQVLDNCVSASMTTMPGPATARNRVKREGAARPSTVDTSVGSLLMRTHLIIVVLVAPDLIYLNKMPLQAAKLPRLCRAHFAEPAYISLSSVRISSVV